MSSQIIIDDKLLTFLSKVSYSEKIVEGIKLDKIVNDAHTQELKDGKPEIITDEYVDMYNEILKYNPNVANLNVEIVSDLNDESGMVGQVYSIGDEVIVTFRGTEPTVEGQIKRDIFEADLGFLNSIITQQQLDAAHLMVEVSTMFPNQKITIAGHSLGGALAVSAAVFTPDSIKGNIQIVKNIDGPGVSDEFLFTYEKEIADLGDKIYYHPLTLIGNLLYYPTNAKIQPIKIHNVEKSTSDLIIGTLNDHTSLAKFNFEENGQFSASDGYDYFNTIQFLSNFFENIGEDPKIIEMDFQNEEEILDYLQKNTEKLHTEYLVRGALLHCSKGSHARRLNLPLCHGVYVGEHPLIHKENAIPEVNIPSFGVCSGSSKSEVISYSADVKRNSKGEEIGPSKGTVQGPKCTPKLVTMWFRSYDKTTIVDNSQSNDYKGTDNNDEMAKVAKQAVTTISFLVCGYEGIIEPYNSGQSYPMRGLVASEDKPLEEVPSIDENIVHEKGSDDSVYGSKMSAPFATAFPLSNDDISDKSKEHIEEMTTISYNQKILAYDFDIIKKYMHNELDHDKAIALAYIFDSMDNVNDIESFINSGYAEKHEEWIDFFAYKNRIDYMIPVPALLGIANNYKDKDGTLQNEIMSQIDADGFYHYKGASSDIKIEDENGKYIVKYPY